MLRMVCPGCLRYFNAAGADPDMEIGESRRPRDASDPCDDHCYPDAQTHPDIRDRLRYTEYGTCVRDFVHVVDIANAHVRALEYLFGGGDSIAMNLANEKGYSVREVVAMTEQICGLPVAVTLAARRPGDPPILIGDPSMAARLLHWQPGRSDLATQIRDAWNWLSKTLPKHSKI